MDGLIINTNHYHTEEMRRREGPRNAIWTGKVPEILIGTRIHESSEMRLMKNEELLRGVERIDEEGIKRILRDHRAKMEPSDITTCKHGEINV